MGFWNSKPAFEITVQTQVGVYEYLTKEYRDRLASSDAGSRASAEEIRRASTEFLININKPKAAIQVLKGIRKGTQQVIPKLDLETAAAAMTEIIFIEIMLKDLGVTDFEP